VSAEWSYWPEYNLPTFAITAAILIWVRRLWNRQLDRVDGSLAVQRENNELLRRAVALLEDIRENSKGKS
jgi:hypothetical protein